MESPLPVTCVAVDPDHRSSQQILDVPTALVNQPAFEENSRVLATSISNEQPDAGRNSSQAKTEEPVEERVVMERKNSYSQVMHLHTRLQLRLLYVGTVTSYSKTMHAFTLSQLGSCKRSTMAGDSTSHRKMIPFANGSLSAGSGVLTEERRASSLRAYGPDFPRMNRRLTAPVGFPEAVSREFEAFQWTLMRGEC